MASKIKWKTDIDENVRSGLVELLILKLLGDEDMYGYQIKQELSKRTNKVFLMKEGSLYGPLYRMSERKLISSKKVVVGEKRFRNYYHLEKEGKKYLTYGLEQFNVVTEGFSLLIHWKKSEEAK